MKGLEGAYAGLTPQAGFLILIILATVCIALYLVYRRKVSKKTLILLSIIFSIGFLSSVAGVLASPLISGVDGPYYPYSVRELLEGDGLEEPDQPVVFYAMAIFAVVMGDITLGVKLAQALFPSLFIPVGFALIFYLTKKEQLSLFMVAPLVFIACALAAKICILKNMAAMVLALLFYLFFIKLARGEGRTLDFRIRKLRAVLNENFLISLFLFGMTALTHFLTAGFVFITVVAHLAFQLGYFRRLPMHELAFTGVLVMVISAGLLLPIGARVLSITNSFAEGALPIPTEPFPFRLSSSPEAPAYHFLPLIMLSIAAFYFMIKERKYPSCVLGVSLLTGLLCVQPWVIDPLYGFRFGFLTLLSIIPMIALGASLTRKRHPKVSGGFFWVFALFCVGMFVGMGLTAGPLGPGALTVEQWEYSAGLREQLPDNCVLTTGYPEYILEYEYWDKLIFDRDVKPLCDVEEAPLSLEEISTRLVDRQYEFQQPCLLLIPHQAIEDENLRRLGLKNTGVQNQKTAVLELRDEIAFLTDLGDEVPINVDILVSLPDLENEGWIHRSLRNRDIEMVEPIEWATLSGELEERENERGKLCLYLTDGWRAENLQAESLKLSTVASNEFYVVLRLKNTPHWGNAEWENLPVEPDHEEEPSPPHEFVMNSNPLFAFILFPIELSEILYGTAAYGVVKLLIAVPLTVGLIGLVLRLCVDVWVHLHRSSHLSKEGRR